jgi:hypothetical protein
MSTIKSSDEHLTLNADGSSKDIKFQANGVEKASISSSGAFTSTTIDATKLTGALPAISGANLTGVGVAGISSSADATAMTIGLDERVAFKATTPKADLHLKAHNNNWTGGMLVEHNSGNKGWHIHPENNSENGLWFGYRADTTSAIGSESVATHLQITSDGRGKSQFTARAWANYNDTTIYDSHNISSMTDVATGMSYANFSNNMANSAYVVQATSYSSHCDKHGPYIADCETGRVKILSLLKTNCDYADRTTHFVIFGD